MSTEVAAGEKESQKLGLFPLIGLVVGSMIGGGVFNLMTDMASSAGLWAIVISWVITGIGMAALVLCFQNLNRKRPDLDAGIYSYAREGFGDYLGFNSAWGYWISAWVGNVGYAAFLFAALGHFFSVFSDGMNWWSVLGASIMLWAVGYLIIRGVKSSSVVNAIVTVAKIIPILIFIIAIIAAFKFNLFSADTWGTALQANGSVNMGDVLNQVKGTMTVTVWVFIGIEGAVLFSGRARKRSDVGKATMLGFLTVLAMYVLVTVFSFGVMTQVQLADQKEPAMAGVLESVVGPWGATLVNLGVIISVGGAWLAWTMFAAELPYQAAKDGFFPKIFSRENKKEAPHVSVIVTCALVQIFIFTFPFIGDSAYNFMYSLATTTILIPYAFSAFYQLKFSVKEPSGTERRAFNIAVGVVSSIYAIWLIYAADPKYLFLTIMLYGPGIICYWWIQKQKNVRPMFKVWELIIAAIIAILFVVAVVLIITGKLTI